MKLIIDPEFEKAIPALSKEELTGLKESIISEGCRDPIVIWNGIIIDGHNRYNICSAYNISFKTFDKQFSNRDEALDWIYTNQLSRRNLTDSMRKYIIGEQYKIRKKRIGKQKILPQNEGIKTETAEKIAQEQKVSKATVERAEQFAENIDKIGNVLGNEIKAAILNEEEKLQYKEIAAIAETVGELVPDQVESIKHKVNESGIRNLGLFTSESTEWYTPPEIIESIIKVLGVISLDPCSDGRTIPANIHYTKDDDGLSKKWTGTVYMNPPYGNEIKEWVRKLLLEWEVGNVKEAIALVPARTDTEWFSLLDAHPWCAVRGRLKFSGNKNSAPFPSAIFYLTQEEDTEGTERFFRTFLKHGTIFQRM